MNGEEKLTIEELERQIEKFPAGSVVYKTIKGKKQPYLQWTENGKTKSRYIRVSEREEIIGQMEQKKMLKEELRARKSAESRKERLLRYRQELEKASYRTNVITGNMLCRMTDSVRGFEKRECFESFWRYLTGREYGRVCLLYGLRRTGKTTLIFQALSSFTDGQRKRSAYIKAQKTDTMADINADLKKLADAEYQYIFIDEVTLMEDFIDSAALFSDVYAMTGMKLVLSGTDSLGFWFALDQELYDRAVTIHTTYIPFREHSRLLGIDSIDEYIRYGGTLRPGETDFEDRELMEPEVSFRDDETARRYIDTAICKNIQHSLACCEHGGHFRHLQDLYEAGELTSAINRIIEDMNHRFLIRTLTCEFRSGDLGSAAEILRKERNPDKRSALLDDIDKDAVTERLKELLDIRNREDQSVGITVTHVAEIREYLKALELIENCPAQTTVHDAEPLEHILFVQPGMRYVQAQALVFSLMKDPVFAGAGEYEKGMITEKILEDVRGRLLEEIVLLETMKTARRTEKVFKLFFDRGEIDMVIYDTVDDCCRLYEVKHSERPVPNQCRNLVDAGKCGQIERRFGRIVQRTVLYRGENYTDDNGVLYRNVEEYLKALK